MLISNTVLLTIFFLCCVISFYCWNKPQPKKKWTPKEKEEHHNAATIERITNQFVNELKPVCAQLNIVLNRTTTKKGLGYIRLDRSYEEVDSSKEVEIFVDDSNISIMLGNEVIKVISSRSELDIKDKITEITDFLKNV